ncbi:uncharacterized protein [Bemisia tabaci]|uniref:uncharacterized protein n=1 Tax=Bemisia tabaci TaxID=7038 RepID=UPI003B28411B
MKGYIALSILGFMSHIAVCHPEALQEDPEHQNYQARRIIKPIFDPVAQRVEVTSQHAFVAPGPDDQRGPCPGLNAMANHNYIPRNGVATIQQLVEGCNKAYGMGRDLALVLAVYSCVMAGDTTKESIGGNTPKVIGGPLGIPHGLSFSHNKFETDASPTRGDLYQFGDASKVQMPQFKQLYGMGNKSTNYNLDIIFDFYAKRLAQSKSDNPKFFHPAVAGVLLVGAYSFIYRLFANHSAEHSDGFLDQETLKSFYAISGEGDKMTYMPGHERIPSIWYKRHFTDEYTVVQANLDVLRAVTKYPQFLDIGGNTGSKNSFIGVDPANLTGGVYTAKNLLQGNNLGCFIIQVLQQAMPDLVKGLMKALTDAVTTVVGSILNNASLLKCPQITMYDKSLYSVYPGYTELLPDGTYTGLSQLVRMLWPGFRRF